MLLPVVLGHLAAVFQHLSQLLVVLDLLQDVQDPRLDLLFLRGEIQQRPKGLQGVVRAVEVVSVEVAQAAQHADALLSEHDALKLVGERGGQALVVCVALTDVHQHAEGVFVRRGLLEDLAQHLHGAPGVHLPLRVGLGGPSQRLEPLGRGHRLGRLLLQGLHHLMPTLHVGAQPVQRIAGALNVRVEQGDLLPGLHGGVEVSQAALTDLGELLQVRADFQHRGVAFARILGDVAHQLRQVPVVPLVAEVLFVGLLGRLMLWLDLQDLVEEMRGVLQLLQPITAKVGQLFLQRDPLLGISGGVNHLLQQIRHAEIVILTAVEFDQAFGCLAVRTFQDQRRFVALPGLGGVVQVVFQQLRAQDLQLR